MIDFVPGQRWFNSAEPDLGLGTVIEVEHRTVTMLFMAAEETRVYAIQNTPLTRVLFKPGDTIRCQNIGQLTVKKVLEENDLIIYQGTDTNGDFHEVSERKLDNFLQLIRPAERLFSEQIDKNQWFELRYQALIESSHFAYSCLYGLSGSRTSLIPHQLYIAHEVGKRYAPRVLLADEVGLGKTIEAGMILQQQLLREQAQRILIVVPETLQHQWLVEMLRRFNLHFSLFDEDRFSDAIEIDPETNPLHSVQRVLCSMDFLLSNPRHHSAITQGEWDLLIVDEAHHLQWTHDDPDPAYTCIETLADMTPGVLLLTATPEQLGKESHFARLRLLDKNRFNSFKQFLEEEKSYQIIAEIIESLLRKDELLPKQYQLLNKIVKDEKIKQTIDNDFITNLSESNRKKLIEHLLDQQGTGRLLFRNTRSAIQGFPERIIHIYPLNTPDDYTKEDLAKIQAEINKPDWTEFDPRIKWLEKFLKAHPNEKALLITASASTAMDISERLRVKHGIHAPVFHEGMSIIERDRVAAFFADQEDGCQILLCSEIGGEGRNFQFASHLILFELPKNPDLLEQRIGRIDRIGQGDQIFIHVPYIKNSAQAVLQRWYYDGLQALQAPCPAAPKIYREYRHKLDAAINENAIVNTVIEEVRQSTIEINQQLQDGRDKLLEINSFKKDVADELVNELKSQNQQDVLENYMYLVFDCFDVDHEIHSDKAIVLHPSETMVATFPCLPDEGTTVTFDRETALRYENMQFLSWEHEMVLSITESILLNERGNTAVIAFSHPSVSEGLMLIECLFILDVIKEARSYITSTVVRTVIGEDMRDYKKILTHEKINYSKEPVKSKIARQIIKAKRKELEKLIHVSQQQVNKMTSYLAYEAQNNARELLGAEAQRLRNLAKVNPNVRQEEITYFDKKLGYVEDALSKPSLRLDAVRVLVSV